MVIFLPKGENTYVKGECSLQLCVFSVEGEIICMWICIFVSKCEAYIDGSRAVGRVILSYSTINYIIKAFSCLSNLNKLLLLLLLLLCNTS